MDIGFDPDKGAHDPSKHGVSLRVGALVLENAVLDLPDDRFAEARRIACGVVDGRLFACAFTMRGATYRIISVRKANAREQRRWLG